MDAAAAAEARCRQACQYYLQRWSTRAAWTPSERAHLLALVRRPDGTAALQDFLAKARTMIVSVQWPLHLA